MSIYHQPWELIPNHIRGKGGREIDKFRGVTPAVDRATGSEAWIGSVTHVDNPPADNPLYGCSEVILPDGRRMYLFEAIALAPEEILGKEHMDINGRDLGVLIKFLDAQMQYTLQCHPTRPWAKAMWDSDHGKEESWYVIGTRDDTAEPAYIFLGFKEGITREEWEKHYFANDMTALENLCHKIPVQVGEAYFVGGGCPHALGKGCFVIEVQEPTDITLCARPYDAIPEAWKKPGEDAALYHARSLGAFIFEGCSYEETLRRWRAPRRLLREGSWGQEYIIIGPEQTRSFSFTELMVAGRAPMHHTGFPQVAIVTAGTGKLRWAGGELDISKGKELFFPAFIPEFAVEGNCTLVLCNPEGALLQCDNV